MLRAYELLTYGEPDPDLTNFGSAQRWREQRDEWIEKFAPSKLPKLSGEPGCSDGYKDAFYQIAELLDMTAMPISPKQAFETVMLPRLRELVAVNRPASHE